MNKLLEVKNLRVSYHTYAGEVQSVRGVSFDLGKGESLAIVGESGCGKTVTAKSIMRLIQAPGEIKPGSQIFYEGKNIFDFTKRQLQEFRGSEIGMIFQDPMTSLNPTMRIGKQIMEVIMHHRGLRKREAKEEALKMLKLVEIPTPENRINQYPYEFSGGMRQRVMIAMALSCNPKILIADEPTTALDVTIQAQIIDLIKELQKKLGMSVIIITHDLGVVADIAQKVLIMYGGKIIERGTAEEIFYNPQHPYTWALLRSIPRVNSDKKGELISIQGTPPDLIAPPAGCPFVTRCKYCMKICRKQEPQVSQITETHSTACWLHHPYAPKVNIPISRGI